MFQNFSKNLVTNCLKNKKKSCFFLNKQQNKKLSNIFPERTLKKPIGIVGVPIDLGAGKRGVDMGPFSIRHAKIIPKLKKHLNLEVHDHGNIFVPQGISESDIVDETAKFYPIIQKVLADLAETTENIYSQGHFPVTIGGDHVLGAGSLSGIQKARRKLGELDVGFLWVDAHTDMNSPATTPSGNMHGMSAAALLDIDVKGISDVVGQDGLFTAERCAWVGIRDVDRDEERNLESKGLIVGKNVFTMDTIDELGISEVMRRALATCAPGGADFVCSFDLDALDPDEAPGVGTPVKGGLTYREAHYAMELCAKHGGLVGMDLVEVNPLLDVGNKTAETAVGLLLSALGRRVVNSRV